MNKVTRYQIIKPVDVEWKVFGNVLNQIQRDTRDVKNKAIQLCWEYQGFSSEYKLENGEYPKAKEILNYSDVFGYAYDKFKNTYNKMNSGNQSVSMKAATDKWKNDVKDILKGEISIPSYKKDCPLDLAGKSIQIIKEENNYYMNLSLVSNPYKKELDLKSGQFLVLVKVGDNNQKTILERILSGEYKQSASQIIRKKNKWFVNLSYKFEPTVKQLDTDNIMGIDMGIVYPVYVAFNNSLNRDKIEGGEIESFRKQVERRKNELYAQGKYCGDGRRGHGTKTRIKPIAFATDKVANFRDTTNHKYSRYIVDMAVKNNCGVIQMEDLTGINKDNVFLKKWSYFDLQTKIEYKAKEVGITVLKVKPNYTSQRCNKCGFIHNESREDQKTFKCVKCDFGHKFYVNADYNAARNISTLDIENIIKEQVELQKANGEWKDDFKKA